ncbi:hypothetical protein DFJ73DRAFT_962887 [Zopfochytrium polystomum]|nr:hypothetical protein DFJ73DRAFT_962887 [Zopfochytrium polystomum]
MAIAIALFVLTLVGIVLLFVRFRLSPNRGRKMIAGMTTMESCIFVSILVSATNAISLLYFNQRQPLLYQHFQGLSTALYGLAICLFMRAFLLPMIGHVKNLRLLLLLLWLTPILPTLDGFALTWLGIVEDQIQRETDADKVVALERAHDYPNWTDATLASLFTLSDLAFVYAAKVVFEKALKTYLGPEMLLRSRTADNDSRGVGGGGHDAPPRAGTTAAMIAAANHPAMMAAGKPAGAASLLRNPDPHLPGRVSSSISASSASILDPRLSSHLQSAPPPPPLPGHPPKSYFELQQQITAKAEGRGFFTVNGQQRLWELQQEELLRIQLDAARAQQAAAAPYFPAASPTSVTPSSPSTNPSSAPTSSSSSSSRKSSYPPPPRRNSAATTASSSGAGSPSLARRPPPVPAVPDLSPLETIEREIRIGELRSIRDMLALSLTAMVVSVSIFVAVKVAGACMPVGMSGFYVWASGAIVQYVIIGMCVTALYVVEFQLSWRERKYWANIS